LTIFYLVRHAHAEWIPDKNRPLSAKGNQDAQRVADVLQTYPVNAIYSSPARRAYQTISPLTERTGIEIKIEADLQERKLGSKVFEDFLGTVERTWHDPNAVKDPCTGTIYKFLPGEDVPAPPEFFASDIEEVIDEIDSQQPKVATQRIPDK